MMYPRNNDQFTRSQGGNYAASNVKLVSVLKKRSKSQFDTVKEETENDKGSNEGEEEEGSQAEYKITVNSNGTIPPSTVYEIITRAVNKDK